MNLDDFLFSFLWFISFAVAGSIRVSIPWNNKKISIYQARFLAPEILFKPELIGEEVPGVHEMLYNSIQKSDLDIRSILYENIFLSGGTTLFKGFGDRLFSEMKDCIGIITDFPDCTDCRGYC